MVEPTANPPWRVLDAPAGTDPATPRTARPDSTSPTSIGATAVGATALTFSPQAAKTVVILLAAALAVAVAVWLAVGGDEGAVRVDGGVAFPLASASADPLAVTPVDAGGEVVVEIVGAVQHPGVYRLPAGSRVGELVTAAGGYGPRIDVARTERSLNLAAPVRDGDQVRVPSRDDPAPSTGPVAGTGSTPGSGSGGSSASATTGGGPIDINRATQAELESLPGIGPVTAQKIIAAREEAPFATVDELRSRKILGEKTFEKVRDLVVVG